MRKHIPVSFWDGGGHVEFEETVDGRWMVKINGYQWGDDERQFDYELGCSTQTWDTLREAQEAYMTERAL